MMSNELAKGGDSRELSKDINVITAEINAYQRVAGEAIFEIGRRLHHVRYNPKEYGLPEGKDKHGNTIVARGAWGEWLGSINMTYQQADRFIRIYEELGGGNYLPTSNKGIEVLYHIATLPPEERNVPHELSTGETKKPEEMTVRELRELKRQLKQAEQQAEAERRERERLEKENSDLSDKCEELANKEPEVITKYVEKETPEFRDRSFDTPYGVKLIDDFYQAMDELSEWQKKYAWITSDNEQLKSFVRVDEDMREEFNKNLNMWRTLSEIFYEEKDCVIDVDIIETN